MNPVAAIKTAKRRRKKLRADAERATVREEWGSFWLHALEPYWFERNQFKRGKRLPRKPARLTRHHHGYGFDAAGRLRYERQLPFGDEYPDRIEDTYFVHDGDGIAVWRFRHDGEPINVEWMAIDDGRVVSTLTAYFESRGTTRTVYTWKDGVLVKAVTGDMVETFEHDALGRLTTIRKRGQVVFARPARGATWKELGPLLRAELESAIRAKVEKLKAKEPIRALALVDEGRLPPIVGAPAVSEREATPADWALFDVPALELGGKKLEALCETLNLQKKPRQERAVLEAVAAALAKRPPTGKGWTRAPGFTVFACDLESGKRL